MAKAIYNVQLMDRATGKAIIAAGGKCLVVTAGGTAKRTILNAITFASLTNALTPTRGNIAFAIDSTTPLADSSDLYIMAPGGQFVIARSVKPGDPVEVWVDTNRREQTLILPFDPADYTAASETDTGFDFTTGMIVRPEPTINVTVVHAAKTIDIGLLSSESGGDADGFVAAASVATAGAVVSKAATTATIGALLKETITDSGAATSSVRHIYPIGATAVSVTYTLSSGTTTAKGFFEIPYRIGITA